MSGKITMLGTAATREFPHWESPDGSVLLVNGDCLKVLKTLGAGSIDCLWTDPPYGHNNNNGGDLIHRWEAALGLLPCGTDSPLGRPIANDGAEANDLVRAMFSEASRLLSPGCCCCCCCCCCGGGPDPQFARWSLWLDEAIGFKQMVVWDKGPMGMGWHYRRSYETVLVGQKPGDKCRWYDKSSRVENIIRPGQYDIRKVIPQADQHPTEKPIELSEHFIRLHSQTGDLILDPFMGSGATGVAAIRLGRKFIGIEIEEKYVDISVKRCKAEMERFPLFSEQEAKSKQLEIFG